MPKTLKQTTSFITYDPTFYKEFMLNRKPNKVSKDTSSKMKTQAGKKFKKPLWAKMLELEQKHIDKVRSFKAIPISDDEYNRIIEDLKNKLSITTDTEFIDYAQKKWKEFCIDATTVLKDNLTFGNVKFGNGLNLGNMNYAIFDKIITRNYQCAKDVVYDEQTVGYETHQVKLFKYHFVLACGFPTFECDRWWRNDMFPKVEDIHNKPLQFAEYKTLTIVVNSRTNRVYCNWEIECCTMVVREKEGAFFTTK
ncbi:predicted protein [Naegleria gruberi]|uniref:Predicted protein n=1 Tax=Naegleria gruberi TaxID=5762 RepID=D2W5N0_NAEGR|nr:uncharacterized protein NAEGRDRAFT_76721 [Naegleria gruberi]EFC35623.1 predicted protein [Naegleria gruberi]|eukprot:XP_002668367.1 predicted protein [Naegleria gruberi strain NEG-M]